MTSYALLKRQAAAPGDKPGEHRSTRGKQSDIAGWLKNCVASLDGVLRFEGRIGRTDTYEELHIQQAGQPKARAIKGAPALHRGLSEF